jgi:hypothetical protein
VSKVCLLHGVLLALLPSAVLLAILVSRDDFKSPHRRTKMKCLVKGCNEHDAIDAGEWLARIVL